LPVWTDFDQLTVYGFPEDQITFHAGRIRIQNGELSWTEGILEYKETLSGTWIPIPANSPVQLNPVDAQGFFRVRVDWTPTQN